MEKLATERVKENFANVLDPVASIQPNGTGIPLCLVAPGMEGLSLARNLGPDRPLLGIRVPNLEHRPPPHTIEDIAAECVRALRRARSNGPYALGGWCAAGVLALEMARQLESEGAQVAFVALFDARTVFLPPMNLPKRVLVRYCHLAQRIGFFLSRVPARGLKMVRGAIKTRVTHAQNANQRARRGLLPSHSDIMYKALAHYRPLPWSGRMVHIWAAERPKGRFRDPEFIWSHLSPSGFAFYEVPGDHLSMLSEPNIAVLSDILASELDRFVER
jgi:thioesterase domain-containing protein